MVHHSGRLPGEFGPDSELELGAKGAAQSASSSHVAASRINASGVKLGNRRRAMCAGIQGQNLNAFPSHLPCFIMSNIEQP